MADDEPKLRESVNISKTTAINPANIGDVCALCDQKIPESGVAWRLMTTTGPGGSIHQKVHSACHDVYTA